MITKKLKHPITFTTSAAKVENLLTSLKKEPLEYGNVTISSDQIKFIIKIVESFIWVSEVLTIRNIGVGIIRKVLNISLSPKEKNKKKEKDKSDKDQKDDSEEDLSNFGQEDSMPDPESDLGSDADSDNESDHDSDSNPEERINHNGKRGSKDIINPKFITLTHPELASGDYCTQNLCTGKIYLFKSNGKIREVVTFEHSPTIVPIILKLEDLRCNLCSFVYKVPMPKELSDEMAKGKRFTYKAQAAMAFQHYGMGMPMNRLNHLQTLTGERLPISTQFGEFEFVADRLKCIFDAAISEAAKGYVIQGDDIACRVLDLEPELRERRSDKAITLREGIHTSILISTTVDGNFIPVLSTGIVHFGEHLDNILSHRPKDLDSPLIVCDSSKSNSVTARDCQISGCFEHLREYFKKAEKNFPKESKLPLSLIKDIFAKDRNTHTMNADQRLKYLQKEAFPIFQNLSDVVKQYLTSQIALPKSELGVALTYFTNQRSKLEIPFQQLAVPIHNNVSEWCTYLIVRLMNNSTFYKNSVGSGIGDVIISIILFCYLSQINPIDYIYYCLKHYPEIKKNPKDFFPYRMKDKIKQISDQLKMNFWAPPPPNRTPLKIP